MTQLAIPSFEVQGFRAFEHLRLEKLGRVNLFTGKNNVGKTSLLESLFIYANQGSPNTLWSLLVDRDEGRPLPELRMMADEELESQLSSIRYLFHGRKSPKLDLQIMKFGPSNSPEREVSIKFTGAERAKNEQRNLRFSETELSTNTEAVPAFLIQVGINGRLIRLDKLFARVLREQFSAQPEIPCIFLPANGLSMSQLAKFWDSITLSPQENDVLKTMQTIEPAIERINLIGNQQSLRDRPRIPIVKIALDQAPMPLRSLGEGMNRMFGLALAMVNTKGGILLIDEIESGLHYSVLPKMWNFIFESAKRLNVQVFATTHSWDCIDGFQQAATASESDGILIRLENKKGKITATCFDEKDLAIATREQIEVR